MAEEYQGPKLSPSLIASIESSTGKSIQEIRETPLAVTWAEVEKKLGRPIRLVSMRKMGIAPEIGEGRGPIEPGIVVLAPERSETPAGRLTKALKAIAGQEDDAFSQAN